MAKVIITITRTDSSKAWLEVNTASLQALFTESETVNILAPSKEVLTSFSGLVSTVETRPDEHTSVRTLTFDTIQNANAAYALFNSTDESSLLYQRRLLLQQKREQLGLDYQITMVVVE